MFAALTDSIESFTRYLVTVTALSCPIRWIRSTACASTIGFHCGSIICTELAAVRFTLGFTLATFLSSTLEAVRIYTPFSKTADTSE